MLTDKLSTTEEAVRLVLQKENHQEIILLHDYTLICMIDEL